jgi:hypothetical protein
VGYVAGKSVEEKKIELVEKYRVETLEPLLKEAMSTEKAVFFVDAVQASPSSIFNVSSA